MRAPVDEVLSYFWETFARNQTKANTVIKIILEERNSHNRVDYNVKKGNGVFLNRCFSNRLVWKKESSTKMRLASWPTTPSIIPASSKIVSIKSELKAFYELTSALSNETEVDFILALDFGLFLPRLLLRSLLLSNLQRVVDAQQYFQQLRELQDYDEKDGTAIGEAFMLKTKSVRGASSSSKHTVSEGGRYKGKHYAAHIISARGSHGY